MSRLKKRVTAAILFLMFISFMSSSYASDPNLSSGGISIRISEISSSERNNPLARLYIVDHLYASSTITRRIEVTNTSNVEQFVSLYPAAADLINGEFVIANGRAINELTSWVQVTPPYAQIAPGDYLTVEVAIHVPAIVTPGVKYGVIWAQMSSSLADSGLVNVNRVGIRMMIPVGAIITKSSDQSRLHLIKTWIKKYSFQSALFGALLLANLLFLSKKVLWPRVSRRRKRIWAKPEKIAGPRDWK